MGSGWRGVEIGGVQGVGGRIEYTYVPRVTFVVSYKRVGRDGAGPPQKQGEDFSFIYKCLFI